MVALLPMSAVAHTKLFSRMSYRSDYRKVEVTVITPELTEIPLVEIPLESPQTLAPEPTHTPIPFEVPTEAPTEVPTPTPEDVDASDQTTTQTDISTTPLEVL